MAETGTDNTNIREQLPTFSTLKKHEQLAVELRSEGKSYQIIANTINVEHDLSYKEGSVRQWFSAGGKLEQAYREYLEWLADESVKQAKLTIKRLSSKAANKLEQLMDDPDTADNIIERAARTILAKYVPDKQVILEAETDDTLPDELGVTADNLVNGGGSGSDQVDDSRESGPTGEDPGRTGNEGVPPEILPEPAAADEPSDPQT